MDGTSACSSVGDTQSGTSAIYEAAMAKRAQDSARVDGANALRLIESASAPQRPLPDGATISVRA